MKTAKKTALLLLSLILVSWVIGCTNSKNHAKENSAATSAEIIVSAAASLTDALNDIKQAYGKTSEVTITFNIASSGTLQKQIEQGAPVDLFISAGEQQMDVLEKKSLIDNSSRFDLLTNELVLVTSVNNSELKSFEDLRKAQTTKIAIGIPETVPAGKYAKEALINLALWDHLQPKLVFTKDVRQVLAYVETENAEAGLVYQSDLTVTDKLRVVAIAPQNSYHRILYPAARVQTSKAKKEALQFLEFLKSKEAQLIFENYGFSTLD